MNGLRAPWRAHLRQASQRVADALFPPRCLACAAALGARPSVTLLCVRCRGRFTPIVRAASCAGCLRALPRSRAAKALCGVCAVETPPFERLIAPWRYEPPLSDAILALKFRRLEFLAAALAELALAREPFAGDDRFDLVVPIPLAPWRRLVRGFNQSAGIAACLGERLGARFAEALRTASFAPTVQSRLGRLARRAPGRRRFLPRARKPLAGKRILLVDDVVTTGATLRAGAAALTQAGAASVVAFALAATPDLEPWVVA